jgi:hypothetical protein
MTSDQPSSAADVLFLAMAHRRLGHDPEARDWLHKAVQVIEQAERSKAAAPEPWYNRLVLRRLRQEAEALVK